MRIGGLADRPFWRDEAWVAHAATDLDWLGLLRQSEFPMPPLFALSVKLCVGLPLPPELGLRMLPFLCGVLILPLSYAVARTLRAPRTVALTGMALIASSPLLVIWSRELKQYELEAFISVLLALLVFRLRRNRGRRGRGPVAAGIVLLCAAGPWFGYGAVFPIAVLMGILIFLRPSSGSRRGSVALGLAGALALSCSTMVLVMLAAGDQAAHDALRVHAGPWFIDVTVLRDWKRAAAYAAITSTMLLAPHEWFGDYATLGLAATSVWVIAVVGVLTWPRRWRTEFACWVFVPWGLMLVAAMCQRYPFGMPRMMVFWAPPMILAFAAGLVNLCRACSLVVRRSGGPGMVTGFAMALAPVAYMVRVPLEDRYWVSHDFPALLVQLESRRWPEERVLVTVNAVPCVRYYARGHDGAFIYFPIAAGTLPIPQYDYDAFIRRTISRMGWRWWLLTTTEVDDPLRDALFRAINRHGYQSELVGERGGPSHGRAQLFVVTRR